MADKEKAYKSLHFFLIGEIITNMALVDMSIFETIQGGEYSVQYEVVKNRVSKDKTISENDFEFNKQVFFEIAKLYKRNIGPKELKHLCISLNELHILRNDCAHSPIIHPPNFYKIKEYKYIILQRAGKLSQIKYTIEQHNKYMDWMRKIIAKAASINPFLF